MTMGTREGGAGVLTEDVEFIVTAVDLLVVEHGRDQTANETCEWVLWRGQSMHANGE